MCEPQWAIAYHSNSLRGRRWYRITRLIQADGQWFELYYHPDNLNLSGKSLSATREAARERELKLLPGVWREGASPRYGNTMERV